MRRGTFESWSARVSLGRGFSALVHFRRVPPSASECDTVRAIGRGSPPPFETLARPISKVRVRFAPLCELHTSSVLLGRSPLPRESRRTNCDVSGDEMMSRSDSRDTLLSILRDQTLERLSVRRLQDRDDQLTMNETVGGVAHCPRCIVDGVEEEEEEGGRWTTPRDALSWRGKAHGKRTTCRISPRRTTRGGPVRRSRSIVNT